MEDPDDSYENESLSSTVAPVHKCRCLPEVVNDGELTLRLVIRREGNVWRSWCIVACLPWRRWAQHVRFVVDSAGMDPIAPFAARLAAVQAPVTQPAPPGDAPAVNGTLGHRSDPGHSGRQRRDHGARRAGCACRPGARATWGDGSPVDRIGIYAGDTTMVVAPQLVDVVEVQQITRTPTAIRPVV